MSGITFVFEGILLVRAERGRVCWPLGGADRRGSVVDRFDFQRLVGGKESSSPSFPGVRLFIGRLVYEAGGRAYGNVGLVSVEGVGGEVGMPTGMGVKEVYTV